MSITPEEAAALMCPILGHNDDGDQLVCESTDCMWWYLDYYAEEGCGNCAVHILAGFAEALLDIARRTETL